MYTVQWRLKKFCKGDESLEDEEHSGRSLEVDNDQLRAITKVDPFTTTQEVAKELNVDLSIVIMHLKKIGKVKSLDKWVPHELTANKKNPCFEVSSSLGPHNNNKSFLNHIETRDEKWILYDNQLSGWMEKKLLSTFQSQPCTKKRSWSLCGGLLCV